MTTKPSRELLRNVLEPRAFVNFSATQLAATYSQSGTTITVTATAHGMSVGQGVFLDFTTGTAVDGYFIIQSVPNANTFTVTAAAPLTTSGNVTRTMWVRSGFNVGSMSRVGMAVYDFTFQSPLANANYCAVACGSTLGGSGGAPNPQHAQITNYATTGFRVSYGVLNVTSVDQETGSIVVFGL